MRHLASALFFPTALIGGFAGCAPSGAANPNPTTTTSTTTAATTAATAAPDLLDWPLLPGWRRETIPFPLSFAPSLPYRGAEEIRFAPRFFDPESETYFTYSFVWVVDGSPAFDATTVAADLRTYFSGLARAVAPKRGGERTHRATITRDQDGGLHGKVETVDAFGDGRALTLGVAGSVVPCGDRATGLVLSMSPRDDAEIWAMLAAQRRTLRCGRVPSKG